MISTFEGSRCLFIGHLGFIWVWFADHRSKRSLWDHGSWYLMHNFIRLRANLILNPQWSSYILRIWAVELWWTMYNLTRQSKQGCSTSWCEAWICIKRRPPWHSPNEGEQKGFFWSFFFNARFLRKYLDVSRDHTAATHGRLGSYTCRSPIATVGTNNRWIALPQRLSAVGDAWGYMGIPPVELRDIPMYPTSLLVGGAPTLISKTPRLDITVLMDVCHRVFALVDNQPLSTIIIYDKQ